ncbi:MAG TPA: DUF5685 family protein [Thermoanaerobaculia bacterium]|nr:DUF5685 family protein [Thermoanaerobaculia bacterium]
MFGLMKARSCALDDDAKETRRLQYCGTCKTLGALYGQRSRLLLNHDTVFLGEVLSALEEGARGETAPDPSIASRNCLALPARDAARTTPLAFAAAATVVLAEAKLADHAADSGKLRWRLGRRFYSRTFEDASHWLREQGFPIDEVTEALAGQEAREARAVAVPSGPSAEASLESLSEPTAFATGAFFAHGAQFAGRPEAEEALGALGRAFGSLVYRLDAFEDYDRDARSGEFNAYRAVRGGVGPLSGEDSLAIRQRIWSQGVEICDLIRSLPIPPARAEVFAERLRTNLAARLGLSPKQAACTCVSALKSSKPAEDAAAEAAPARPLRESLALLLNLPFLASAVSGLASPLYFSASGPGGLPGAAGEAVKHVKKGGGGKGGSDCGCCDACDCGDCCCDCDC